MPKFPLEQLHRYSQSIKDADSNHLAKARREHSGFLQRVESVVGNIKQNRKKLDALYAQKNIDIDMIKLHSEYDFSQNSLLKEMLKELDKLEAEVENKRKKLITSTTKVKTFEILKQKHVKHYYDNLKRQETKTMDEIAVRNHQLKQ